MKVFIIDLSSTMQARMLKFGMRIDGKLLYRVIENQPSPGYSSLYLSNFFHSILE